MNEGKLVVSDRSTKIDEPILFSPLSVKHSQISAYRNIAVIIRTMRFLTSLLLLLAVSLSCFANEHWTVSVDNLHFQAKAFTQKAEGILTASGRLVLFSVESETRAALFFTDPQMQRHGVLIFNQTGDGVVIGGISDPIADEIKLRRDLRQILETKTSLLELFVPKARAEICGLNSSFKSFSSLKSVMTKDEVNLYASWAQGCGRGLIEGAIEGTLGSKKTILDMVQAVSSLSGPAETWEKLKSIPTKLTQIVRQFHHDLQQMLAGDASLPPDMAGELLCSFITEHGVKALVTAVTGVGGMVAIFAGIKSFIEKIGKLVKVVGETARLKKMFSNVSEKYRHVISKLEANAPVPGAVFEEKNLNRHFKKHQTDIGASTPAEYAKKAFALAESTEPDVLVLKGSKSGAIFKYRESTNEFLVINKTGKIETYFKPDPAKHGLKNNMEYFLSQYDQY